MDSDSSIEEIDKPPKPIPPVISIDEDEELVINVTKSISVVPEVVAHEVEREVIINYDIESDHMSPYHWTVDMKNFYNADWGNEDGFHVDLLQKKMSKGSKLWAVSNKDLLSNSKVKKHVQCRRCMEFGHKVKNCDSLLKLKCFMCGNDDHMAKYCPRRSCLTCGKRTKIYIAACGSCLHARTKVCSRCRCYGHNLIDCPDHWRRYHNTTNMEPIVPTQSANKPSALLWCCNCGRKGHDAFSCREKNNRDFQCPNPFVCTYEDFFKRNKASKSSGDQQFKRYYENSPSDVGNITNTTDVNSHPNSSTAHIPSLMAINNFILPFIPSIPPLLPYPPTMARLELESLYRNDIYRSRYESDMSFATPPPSSKKKWKNRKRCNSERGLPTQPESCPDSNIRTNKRQRFTKRKKNATDTEEKLSKHGKLASWKRNWRRKKSKQRNAPGTPNNPIAIT